jgi:hypothetical protein
MPSKDISQLTADLRKDAVKLKGKIASAMVQDLQAAGPWWTGHFATSWKISDTPVQPITKSRLRESLNDGDIVAFDAPLHWQDEGEAGMSGSTYDQIRTNRDLPKRKRPKDVTLEKDLYIGNEAEYAGFAVNNPGATAPVGDPNGVTYDRHAELVDNITPPSGNPDWYKIYMGNQHYNDAIALALSETFKAKNISFSAD